MYCTPQGRNICISANCSRINPQKSLCSWFVDIRGPCQLSFVSVHFNATSKLAINIWNQKKLFLFFQFSQRKPLNIGVPPFLLYFQCCTALVMTKQVVFNSNLNRKPVHSKEYLLQLLTSGRPISTLSQCVFKCCTLNDYKNS